MTPETQKLIQERFAEVPESVQGVLLDPEFAQKVSDAAQKHNVPLSALSSLENEIVLTLLSFTPPKEFSQVLTQKLLVSRTTADALAEDIFFNLLTPEAMTWLSEVQKEGAEDVVTEEAAETAQQAEVPRTPLDTPAVPEKGPSTVETTPETTSETPRQDTPEPQGGVEGTEENVDSVVPRYAKPLTQTPKYDTDPYKESVG